MARRDHEFLLIFFKFSDSFILIPITLLAIVQGLSEFLPISSSGHLLVLSDLFAYKFYTFSRAWGLFGDLTLHVGTLLAASVFFFPHIKTDLRLTIHEETRKHSLYFWMAVVLATSITGLIGLIVHDFIESLFYKAPLTVPLFFLTGVALLISRRFISGTAFPQSIRHALVIGIGVGLAQSLALMPGISRSGFTIVTATALGLEASAAFRFSFYTGIPLMAAAWVYDLLFSVSADTGSLPWFYYLWGILVSAVVGWYALKWLEQWTITHRLHWFGYYCFTIAFLLALVYFV